METPKKIQHNLFENILDYANDDSINDLNFSPTKLFSMSDLFFGTSINNTSNHNYVFNEIMDFSYTVNYGYRAQHASLATYIFIWKKK